MITIIYVLEKHHIPTDIIQQICPLVVHPCAYEIPWHSSVVEDMKDWLYQVPRKEHPILKHILRDWVQLELLTQHTSGNTHIPEFMTSHQYISKSIEYDEHPAIWFKNA
jgi:hypothetical protein